MFSKRLKELRKFENLSMKDLAKQIKVTDAAISNWENDVNEPKLGNIVCLAKRFKVSSDYLVGLVDDFEAKTLENDLSLSKQEYELVELFRKLSEKDKKILYSVIQLIIENDNK